MIDYVGEDDLEQFFNSIDYVLSSIGIDDFYDFKSLDLKKIYNAMEYFGTKARSYIDKIKPELQTPKRTKIEKPSDKKQ